MPIKSWAFLHGGHIVRAEILWKFLGRNRQRLYVDHIQIVSRRGNLKTMRPMLANLADHSIAGEPIAVRFTPRWFRIDMACEISSITGLFEPVKDAFVDKQWQALGWDEDDESRSGPNWGCLIVFPFLIVMMVLLPFLAMLGGLIDAWNDRMLRHRLRAAGRILSWADIEERMRLLQSPCTLIHQLGNLARQKVWWTEDDVPIQSPLPMPANFDLLQPGGCDHPFITWCDSRYLSATHGKAFLTDLPSEIADRLSLSDRASDEQLSDNFPLLKIIGTSYPTKKQKRVGPAFCDLLGQDLDESLPRLAEACSDENLELRRLCLKTIVFASDQAASIAPNLKDRFFFGPKADRYLIAKALAEMGTVGMDILHHALTTDDPHISGSAKSALATAERAPAPVALTQPRVQITPEIKNQRIRNERYAIVLYFVAFAALIGSIIAGGWYLGTLETLAIFLLVSFSAIGIFIWLQVRRVKARVKKSSGGKI